MRKRASFAAGGALLAASVLCSVGVGQTPAITIPSIPEQPIRGVSIPVQYEDNVLSFTRPGIIAEVLVKEGDTVEKGQVVAKEDDSEEQKQLEVDNADLFSNQTELDVEIAILKQDQDSYQHYIDANAGWVEREDAQQKVTVDEARVKLARTKIDQSKSKVAATEALIKKLTLTSPAAGVVAQRFLNAGEVADNGNMRMLRIVSVDPMWVEARVPTAQARKLKVGDSAYVTLSDKGNKVPAGKVIFISPLASSANETIMVRIEVPNPQKLQPGENVTVKFGGEAAVGSAAP